MRRLAECAPELAAEVGARKTGGTSEIIDLERLRVRRVDEIASSQQVALRRNDVHRLQFTIVDTNQSRAIWR